MASIKAPEISKRAFGGIFDIDSAGQMPGIELITFIVGSKEGVLPNGKVTRTRVAHDFARRLIHDKTLDDDSKKNILIDSHSEAAVARLLRGLEIDIPNKSRSAAMSWERAQFFPYTRSLVHGDARIRRGRVVLERRYMRGAGAYAFHILRNDVNEERLQRLRSGFEDLYPAGRQSPLEQLAATLKEHGAKDESPVEDQIESQSRLFRDEWEELLCSGVDNILSYTSLATVDRIRAIINWTGIWSVIMLSGRCATALGRNDNYFLFDCAGRHPQLRRASQKNYKHQLETVEEMIHSLLNSDVEALSTQQLGKIRGYFGNTVVGCGLGNAWKGRRHFLFRVPAISTLVMAGVPAGQEMELDRFISNWLYDKCRFVVGRHSAGESGLLSQLDATIFEENESQIADQLFSIGMLKRYSDATRMVSVGGAR